MRRIVKTKQQKHSNLLCGEKIRKGIG